MKWNRIYSIVLTGALGLGACKKTKVDHPSGNLPETFPITSSTVRLVNLGGFTDLAINGQKLTDFVLPSMDGTRLPSPTAYFPTTGQLGQTYYIPQSFIGGNDSVNLSLYFPTLFGYYTYHDSLISCRVGENYNHPNDYYWVMSRTAANPGTGIVVDSMYVIPRAVSPAADPTHILVRLVNLSSAPDGAGLVGGMRLALADGSSVAAGAGMADTLVSPGNTSPYYELPYGTYQFKVLTAQNVQVPGSPPSAEYSGGLTVTSATSALTNNSMLTYAPVATFQPGGVYSIVVSVSTTQNAFQVPYGGGTVGQFFNCYQTITDVAPSANITYGRLQAVNAFPGAAVGVKVDGQDLAKGLAYDSSSAYQVYAAGTHTVTLVDAGGNQLAQQTLDLQGNTNFTIWAYPLSGGGAGLLLAQNNLSGSRDQNYNGDGIDNANDVTHTSYPSLVRFLNLCPDLPYVTFTKDNGGLFVDYFYTSALAAQNLPYGAQLSSAAVPFPYVTAGPDANIHFQVYQSQPSIVPGDWLSDIVSLPLADFVSMPASYYTAGMPNGEPGIYTVALTGRYGPNAPAGQEAKLIFIKHTK